MTQAILPHHRPSGRDTQRLCRAAVQVLAGRVGGTPGRHAHGLAPVRAARPEADAAAAGAQDEVVAVVGVGVEAAETDGEP